MRNVKGIAAMLMAFVLVFTVPIASATVSVDEIYTKVNTIYGQVNVPVNTYNRMGIEKITTRCSELLGQIVELTKMNKEELNKMNEQREKNTSDNVPNLTEIAPSLTTGQLNTNLRWGPQERTTFTNSSGVQPTTLYGCVYPGTIVNNGEQFVCKQEREIELIGTWDWVEIVCEQNSGGTTYVFATVYDYYYYPVDTSEFFLSITNPENPLIYIVNLNSNDLSYEVTFTDSETGESYYDSYIDDDDFSSNIKKCYGSTELTDDSGYRNYFYVSSRIVDFNTKVNGIWRPASETYNSIDNSQDVQYVYARGFRDGSCIYSDQAAGLYVL